MENQKENSNTIEMNAYGSQIQSSPQEESDHVESPVNAWTWVRLALAVVLCPPVGIIALMFILLALRARSQSIANSDSESYNKSEKMVKVANVLILIGIIVGPLSIAAAGIAFGLTASNSEGGCEASQPQQTSTTVKPQPESRPPYRLPLTVRPRNYALRLQPMLEPPFTLSGKVDIDIEVFEPVKEITLNSLEIKVVEAKVDGSM